MPLPLPSAEGLLNYVRLSAAVAKFLASKDLKVTVENIRDFFRSRKEQVPPDFEPEDAKGLINFLVINPDLLDVLLKKLEDALRVYNGCLAAARHLEESKLCDSQAEIAVCDTLRRIKLRNDGDLPEDEKLRNCWLSFGCRDFPT